MFVCLFVFFFFFFFLFFFHFIFVFSKVGATEWSPILENSCTLGLRYVFAVFKYLGLWSGNFFLIAPFPGYCLLLL